MGHRGVTSPTGGLLAYLASLWSYWSICFFSGFRCFGIWVRSVVEGGYCACFYECDCGWRFQHKRSFTEGKIHVSAVKHEHFMLCYAAAHLQTSFIVRCFRISSRSEDHFPSHEISRTYGDFDVKLSAEAIRLTRIASLAEIKPRKLFG